MRELFDGFPLPLVIGLGGVGSVEVNARFVAPFDPASLRTASLSRLLTAPHTRWEPVELLHHDGTPCHVHAQSLRFEDGLLLVIDDTPGDERPEDVAALHARVHQLERESATDRLTGAWNRAHLDRVIEAEIARSTRFRLPLSLVLIDIDHFKRVNDQHGHQAGDLVLRDLVAVVRAATRASDLLFRWGGEEFVVLAASAGHRAGEKVGEAVRRAVAAAAFPAAGALTVSVGVAEHLVPEDATTWFARADAMLYAAKSGGRDRVCVDRRGSSDLWAHERGHSALRLEWQESYESGEPTIDAQHRRLFELANVLIDAALDPRAPRETTLSAADQLIAHIVQHFADEERVLEHHGYPHLEAHRRSHERLVLRAQKLYADMRADTAQLGDVIEFLAGHVVARHLLTADREFFPLFAAPPP